jgi:hypothetical protein
LTDAPERDRIVVRVEENPQPAASSQVVEPLAKPDGEWVHVELAPDKWAMVRVGGDTIVSKREKALGDIEFEIERLKANGEFEES